MYKWKWLAIVLVSLMLLTGCEVHGTMDSPELESAPDEYVDAYANTSSGWCEEITGKTPPIGLGAIAHVSGCDPAYAAWGRCDIEWEEIPDICRKEQDIEVALQGWCEEELDTLIRPGHRRATVGLCMCLVYRHPKACEVHSKGMQ